MVVATQAARNKIAGVLRAEGNKVSNQLRNVSKLQKDDSPEVDPVIAGLSLNSLDGIADIEPELEDIGENAARLTLAQLKVGFTDDIVGQINNRALAYARARGAELVSMIDDSTRDMLRDTIADGLADNLSFKEIADIIESTYAFSDDRALLIAETEIGLANGQGALDGMKQAEQNGVRLLKQWQVDPDPCPICIENGDAGPIELDDVFPSGDDAPYAHPNCRCVLISVEIKDGDNE